MPGCQALNLDLRVSSISLVIEKYSTHREIQYLIGQKYYKVRITPQSYVTGVRFYISPGSYLQNSRVEGSLKNVNKGSATGPCQGGWFLQPCFPPDWFSIIQKRNKEVSSNRAIKMDSVVPTKSKSHLTTLLSFPYRRAPQPSFYR